MINSVNQVPQNRLTWPALLDHPFVHETLEDVEARVTTDIEKQATDFESFICSFINGTIYQNNRRFELQQLLQRDLMQLGGGKEIFNQLS